MLDLLREDLSNEQIAERLGVTLRTARYHVSEILGKLGLRSRKEAARWQPEQRPWWATALAPVAFLSRVSGAAVPVNASAVAMAATVGIVALAVGGLAVMGVLLMGGGAAGDSSTMVMEAQTAQPVDAGGETQTAPTESCLRGDVDVFGPSTMLGLVHDSDIIILGTVLAQTDQTSSVVAEGMVATNANYTLEPERYFRGKGGTTLDFRLTVAHNFRDQCLAAQESADPLTVGGRYIFFLKQTPDGVTLAAEPGRFRIEDAIARVESTIASAGYHGVGVDFSDRFPARPLADLIEEVVSAAAAPAPIPPTPSEPPHEHAPHEDDF